MSYPAHSGSVTPYIFWTLAVDVGEWSATLPACFTMWEKKCSTHWLGIQTDPRASLGILETTVSLTLLTIIQPLAYSMYWQNYLDYSIEWTLGFPETGPQIFHKSSSHLQIVGTRWVTDS